MSGMYIKKLVNVTYRRFPLLIAGTSAWSFSNVEVSEWLWALMISSLAVKQSFEEVSSRSRRAILWD